MATIEMTNQEMLNKSYSFLKAQGMISYHDGHSYYNKYGNKCAIGCLLPVNLDTELMEGKSISYVIKEKHLAQDFDEKDSSNPYLRLFTVKHCSFLSDLQDAHDSIEKKFAKKMPGFSGVLYKKYSKIAKKYDLKMPKR